jgi:hypothetical protein
MDTSRGSVLVSPGLTDRHCRSPENASARTLLYKDHRPQPVHGLMFHIAHRLPTTLRIPQPSKSIPARGSIRQITNPVLNQRDRNHGGRFCPEDARSKRDRRRASALEEGQLGVAPSAFWPYQSGEAG